MFSRESSRGRGGSSIAIIGPVEKLSYGNKRKMFIGTLLVGSLLMLAHRTTTDSNFHLEPGPWIQATRGEVWPLPLQNDVHDGFFLVRSSNLEFQVSGETCDIVQEAVQRYSNILLAEAKAARHFSMSTSKRRARKDPMFKGNLSILDLHLVRPCEQLPHLRMNESYTLEISESSGKASLVADSVWGILRGLETFSQLLVPSGNGANLMIKCQFIMDKPRLPHRGLLLDTSRHFIPVTDILLVLDAMSYNKLNVFHWHIVDDNSFPYQSSKYPELSAQGAYHSSLIYSSSDVQEIIEYARLRGIRVLSEFDTPGHTRSWGLAYPSLLTPCYGSNQEPDGTFGPMNPTDPLVYSFLNELFTEIVQVFPDRYVHLGGDEVPFDCWSSNPKVVEYMRERGMEGNYSLLESEFIRKLMNITNGLNVSSIVWQEVFDNRVSLQPETVIHIWKGNWQNEMTQVTKAGYYALLSSCWYLDHLASGGDWKNFYDCDPLDFFGSAQMEQLVLGGEACMWGEFVDRNNAHSRIWPRACASAERLWSSRVQDLRNVSSRLEEHTCRMNRRGVPAQPPNGPGFCIV